MISRKEIIEAYINIGTMFGTKPTKELIKSIPKKDLVDVCYRLYEIIEEQEKRIDKAIDSIDMTIDLIKQQPTEDDSWILGRLNSFKIILKGEDNYNE